MAEPLGKRLRRFFGFRVDASKDTKRVEISPVEKESKEGKHSDKPIDLPSNVKKIWDWYVRETNDRLETLKHRMDRYTDIDYMIYNEPIVSYVVELYADEVSQIDDQFNLIQVKAKNQKVEKRIKSLLEQWGVDQSYIREVAYNLVAYGDSFDILETNDKKGIVSLTPVSVDAVTDRLEFKLSEIKKKFSGAKKHSYQKIKSLQDFIRDMEFGEDKNYDYSKNYLSYLFGFVVGEDSFVYPWQVNHYRLESRRSEFFPFGRSLLINLIGPYRQLKTSMNLMALTRAMKFPKEVYEVQTSDEMTAVEKWHAVNEAKTEYQNLGILNNTKDEFSVGDEIWIPDGLIRHTVISNDLRIEDIADIELLRENLIMGTKIPRGYLIADDRGGWGVSGQSLLQQSKPFGRAVYFIQSSILNTLTHMIRTHFLMTGEFEKEYTEFQISLNFPVVEEASDRQRLKQDSLRFVTDIIDNIKNALGDRDAELSPKVVKDLFSKFSFLDPDILDDVINSISQNKSDDGYSDLEFEGEDKKVRIKEQITKIDEDILNASYFESIRTSDIKECISNGRHYYTSNGKYLPKEFSSIYRMFRFVEANKEEDGKIKKL